MDRALIDRVQALRAERGRDPDAVRVGLLLLSDLAAAGVAGDHPLRLQASVDTALALSHGLRHGEAHRVLEEAVGACGGADAVPGALACALAQTRCALHHPDQLETGLWAIQRADAEADVRAMQDARACVTRMLVSLSDLGTAERWCAEAEALGGPAHRPQILVARGELARAQGRFDEARVAWEGIVAFGRQHDRPADLGLGLQNLAGLARRREPLRALDLLVDAERAFASVDHRQGQVASLNERGEILRALGRFDEARASFDRALALGPNDTHEAVLRLNRGLVELDAGAVREAARVLARVPRTPAIPVLAQLADLGSVPHRIRRRDPPSRIDRVLADHAVERLAVGGDPDLLMVTERIADTGEARGDPQGLAWAARAMAIHHGVAERSGDRHAVLVARGRLQALAAAGARTALGPFELHAPIGSGNSGAEVWSARHAASGAEVAIKVLTDDGERGRALLANELRSLAALEHPHIVWLLHHGVVGTVGAAMGLPEGAPWIAMERAQTTVEALCGHAPWERCREVLLAVLDALAHAHARGLLHLDIKPANVLLSHEGVPRLADFGIAAALAQRRRRVAGTPEFMAPEQFESDRVLDGRADLYAVGCLAASLVQGTAPYVGSTDTIRALHALRHPAHVQPVVPVPAGFEEWVRSLLALRVEDRLPHPVDAARALYRLGDPLARPVSVTLPLDEEGWLWGDGAGSAGHGVPAGWVRSTVYRPAQLVDAGLGLYAVRRHALVARERERDLLWSLLRTVLGSRRSRIAVLIGPPGAGTKALADWLVERALEVGAITPSVGPARGLAIRRIDLEPGVAVDPEGLLVGAEPVLAVVTARELPDDDPVVTRLLDHPSTVPVAVAPLGRADAVAVLRSRLAITVALAETVVDRAATLADAVMQLDAWVEAGALVLGQDGYALRPGPAAEFAAAAGG